ncbi:MAG: hypothetical protein FWD26_00005, partial [Treponema sp.]|nr:hypothetical protein [Treponema sp.]
MSLTSLSFNLLTTLSETSLISLPFILWVTLWVYPPPVYTKISTNYNVRRGKMAKKMKERRQYTQEFKTEAV